MNIDEVRNLRDIFVWDRNTIGYLILLFASSGR